MGNRARIRKEFISKSQWGNATLSPLLPDASLRQYFRLMDDGKTAMLMDASLEPITIRTFLRLTDHLRRLGLRVPQIFCHDADSGFMLMEDLGSDTFTALLNVGTKALPLYEKAINVLIELQNNPDAINIDTTNYDFESLVEEACLLTRWYLPAVTGKPIERHQEAGYIAAWKAIYECLPDIDSTLVLRDYHVDNLMLIDERCALLDYQDALIGSPAYDVVSLLEDARRDVDETMHAHILEIYLNQRPQINRPAFRQHYIVWGVQRHCKVVGIFTRLWLRDNKPSYLQHLPRVLGLLRKNLNNPCLSPLYEWFKQHQISLHAWQPQASRQETLSRIGG